MHRFPTFATALAALGVPALFAVAMLPANALARPAAAGPMPTLATACEGRDAWDAPAPPQRIFGNTWYVGTCGISAVLVTSPAGHILVDGGVPDAAPLVLANIRAAGFRPRDVRWIVSSHEHWDHAGALAALKRATGARLALRAPSAKALASGTVPASDPQAAGLRPSPAVTADRTVDDGAVVSVGSLRLTAHATPGHSPGSTSWTWRSCAGADCRAMAYADSVTALGSGPWRFSDHPDYVAAFRRGLATVAALPCDVLMTPHPEASDLFARLAHGTPPRDPGACRAYAARGATRLDETLAKEAGAPQKPAP